MDLSLVESFVLRLWLLRAGRSAPFQSSRLGSGTFASFGGGSRVAVAGSYPSARWVRALRMLLSPGPLGRDEEAIGAVRGPEAAGIHRPIENLGRIRPVGDERHLIACMAHILPCLVSLAGRTSYRDLGLDAPCRRAILVRLQRPVLLLADLLDALD